MQIITLKFNFTSFHVIKFVQILLSCFFIFLIQLYTLGYKALTPSTWVYWRKVIISISLYVWGCVGEYYIYIYMYYNGNVNESRRPLQVVASTTICISIYLQSRGGRGWFEGGKSCLIFSQCILTEDLYCWPYKRL